MQKRASADVIRVLIVVGVSDLLKAAALRYRAFLSLRRYSFAVKRPKLADCTNAKPHSTPCYLRLPEIHQILLKSKTNPDNSGSPLTVAGLSRHSTATPG